MTDFTEQARREVAIEDAAKAEQRIADRANTLQEADRRAQAHRALCGEHDLPESATPADVAAAYIKRRDEILGAVASSQPHGRAFIALSRELGLDPDALGPFPNETIWTAMRERNHPLLAARRDPATGALVMPLEAGLKGN